MERHGADRTAVGVDMVLDEWVSRAKGLSGEAGDAAWADLRKSLKLAKEQLQRPLALRLTRALLHDPALGESRRGLFAGEILSEENVPHASPAVLEFMLDEGQKRGQEGLAERAAAEIVSAFPETDYVIPARMLLARRAISEDRFADATAHLDVVRKVFASRPEAAEALLLLGEAYLKQRRYDKADESYRSVLAVREWRGPLWPAALHGRAECARLSRDYRAACAFYERIYVLYSHYGEWVSKAYLWRAKCLARLGEFRKATQTLKEMLAAEELSGRQEAAEARELLQELQGRI